MKLALALALALVGLCGCTSLPVGSVRPPDPPELRAVDVTLAAWRAAGFPIPGSIPSQIHKLAVLPRATDAQVVEWCQVPACEGVDPPLPFYGCAYACTSYADEAWPFNVGTPIIVISEHVPATERARGEPVIHETLHILAWGLLHNPDMYHRDARLWTALQQPDAIQTRARERYLAQ